MRVNAPTMSCAQGQDGGIFQAPAALAFDDPPGGMQDRVAQRLWFCFGHVRGHEKVALAQRS